MELNISHDLICLLMSRQFFLGAVIQKNNVVRLRGKRAIYSAKKHIGSVVYVKKNDKKRAKLVQSL